jgi:chromosome segregation ATPase
MAVDSNFERLESQLNRLVEGLDKLRQENTELQERIQSLESENGQLHGRIEQLQPLEEEQRESLKNREEVKGRLENLLAKLDQVQV